MHYHTPYKMVNGKLMTSGIFGVFLDSLAEQVDLLYCFLHESTEKENHLMDYELQSQNIKLISLGPHTPLYNRLLKASAIGKIFYKYRNELDYLLIRTPTPLVFQAAKSVGLKKTTLLLVGDYKQGAKTLDLPLWKKWLIQAWTEQFNQRLVRLIKKVHVLSNSEELRLNYRKWNSEIEILKTTTLSHKSFFNRENTCKSSTINLLYTGRIDLGKGLIEIIEALALLRKLGHNVNFQIAGWDDSLGERTTLKLKQRADELGVTDNLVFLGKKKVGDELNQTYRNADIYLLCSQLTEGFPRTIWEAMANSIPVVATKVGSIPFFLTHKHNAYLIDGGNIQAIVTGVSELLNDAQLRSTLIKNAQQIASENTLENQAKKLIQLLNSKK